MKEVDILNNLQTSGVNVVRNVLAQVPSIEVGSVERGLTVRPDYYIDARIFFSHGDVSYALIVEVIQNGAPRFVRSAIHLLKSCINHILQFEQGYVGPRLIPMIVSPYLSLESRSICRDHNVSFLDIVGNAHLSFENVYIERAVTEKPKSVTRALRSIFSPRAGAILRVLLSDPNRTWRVANLAEAANASFGHVSNVRKFLLEREWAENDKKGFKLIRPDSVLKTWRTNYRSPVGRYIDGYTHLHGEQLDIRLKGQLNSNPRRPLAIYSFHSAAQWVVPYGRDGTHKFYADESGAELLKSALDITPVKKGANVIVRIPNDESLFEDAVEQAPGIFCTNPIITYLDLWNGNERDREAAEHMAGEVFPWL